MRVIAGSARGRRLQCLDDRQIRPTRDRIKEAVFSSLAQRLPDSRVLDLFAGSGALGIEALSRGAKSAVFVEADSRACALIKSNLAHCGWDGPAAAPAVVREDALLWLEALRDGGFDIVFADPPYHKGFEEAVLSLFADGNNISPGGILVLESGVRQDLPDTRGRLYLWKSKVYGVTKISYYRINAEI